MNKFYQFIKNKVCENAFFKTYILILLPVLIILIYLLISVYSYNKNYTDLLKGSYLTKLESVCTQNETSLQNIATLISTITSEMSGTNFSQEQIREISETFSQVTKNNALLDSISIYDRSEGIVYADNTTYNAITYFSSVYSYDDFEKNYWDNYTSLLSERRILAPTLVKATNSNKIIIPIVFSKIGEVSTNKLIIVNVNLSLIIHNANLSKLTENSTFLVVNKQNRNVFDENDEYTAVLPDYFFESTLSEGSSVFDCTVRDENSLVLSYSPGNSILGYSYVALVPYSDINHSMSHISYFILLLGLFSFITVLGTVYFSTKKIYSPIEKLASLFEDSDSSDASAKGTDTLQKLHSSIQATLESNTSLSKEVSKALPLVQERHLISLLNSNEHYISQDDTVVPIDFKFENFCSVVIKLRPTEQFYNMYNNMEYNSIKSGIHNIIQSIFSEKYEVYIIPSETDTLYVLLNLPDDTQTDAIIEILSDFQQIMEFDKEYMTLKIGLGGIYPHLDGLKKSHHEAVNSVSSFTGLTHLRLYNEGSTETADTYILNMNDENILLNHLILGRVDDAKGVINKILGDNISNKISDTSLVQLYIQLLSIVFKVMRMKNIVYDHENTGDFHIITEIIKQSVTEVHDTLMSYIEIISNHMGNSNTKVDIQAIISFMENNFYEDIGLESIADNFNTTPKYLSKLIKDKLGVNFVDYLAGLRINAAKVLLFDTDKTISEIYEEVGFNNRNTFIRSFKKNTGLTPSEFRKSKNN